MAESGYANGFSYGLKEGLAEGNPNVFDGVMGVYFVIAGRFHIDVEEAMFGEVGEHVVEEGISGGYVGAALAVEVDGEFYLRFVCFS